MTAAGGRLPGAGGPAPRPQPATATARETARARATARALAVTLAAAVALAAVSAASGSLGACGGEEAGREYTGFWRAADVALADCTLVKVWQDGDAYLVRVDYGAPRPARLGPGRLLVEADEGAAGPAGDEGDVGSAGDAAAGSTGAAAGSTSDAAGLELACDLVPRRGALVLVTAARGASPLEVVLQSISEAAYEAELATLSDDRVRSQLMELAAAVQAWAETHAGRPPAADLLAPGSEFALSLARLGVAWPTNPFTAAPMHAGDGPGDFTYATAGRDFELIGHLSGGEAYAAE